MTKPILIVGAGPTGLTLGAALKAKGIPCRIIDRRDMRGARSRATGIQARTLDVFARLGIAKIVEAEAKPLTGYAFHWGTSPIVAPFRGVHPRFPAMTILPQTRTEAILETIAPPVEWGRTFVGRLPDGAACITNAAGCVQTIDAQWIIGCDGIFSSVRNAAGINFDGKTYAARLLLADCHLEGLEPGLFHVFMQQSMIAFALPGDRWRVVTVLPDQEITPPQNDMSLFQRPGIRICQPEWWSRFVIQQRQANQLRAGNILLAGDAAHVHAPTGGQGMNIGIQDAWWLAEALVAGEAAIDQWSRDRHALATKVLRATDRMTNSMLGTSTQARTSGAMLGGASWLGTLRQGAMKLLVTSRWGAHWLENDLAGSAYPSLS